MKTSTKVILEAASRIYGQPVDVIKAADQRLFLRIRALIYEASRRITRESVCQTSAIMDKHHSTVLYFLKKDKDVEFMLELNELIEASLFLAQRARHNTLQHAALVCYNDDGKTVWKLQHG